MTTHATCPWDDTIACLDAHDLECGDCEVRIEAERRADMTDLNEELWNLVKECKEDAINTLLTIDQRHGRLHAGAKLEHLLTRHNIPKPRRCGECENCDEQGFCYPDPETVPFWVKEWGVGSNNARAMHCPCFKEPTD